MKLDFYLSEMSVSDQHGGGLTLQRVLGEDLNEIQFFAQVSRFGTDYPIIDNLKSRGLAMPQLFESHRARRIIGCRLADRISRLQFVQKKHARQCARAISAKFPHKDSSLKALVCPQGAVSLYTLDYLCRSRPIDYITWVMDDHLLKWDGSRWCYPPGVEEVMSRHLHQAKHVIVISEVMSEFYKMRFGIESTVLFGPAEWNSDKTDLPQKNTGGLRLGYFGSVGTWQMDALALVARQVKNSGSTLDIYSSIRKLPAELDHPSVNLKSPIAPSSVMRTMGSYDAVVLPVSFKNEYRNMSEFNIATKMSECLASGSVTLAIGPSYSAMIRFLTPLQAAQIVSTVSDESIIEALSILKNTERRNQIIASAKEIVKNQLSSSVVRSQWRMCLAGLF